MRQAACQTASAIGSPDPLPASWEGMSCSVAVRYGVIMLSQASLGYLLGAVERVPVGCHSQLIPPCRSFSVH